MTEAGSCSHQLQQQTDVLYVYFEVCIYSSTRKQVAQVTGRLKQTSYSGENVTTKGVT